MQKNNNECLFEKCVYVSVAHKIIEAASIDENQTGKIIAKSDWCEIEKTLFEAREGRQALTLLLSDSVDSLNVKWIAIIDNIETESGSTTVDFIFFEELKFPIPSFTLRPYSSENGLGDSLAGIPTLCKSPEMVNDYLNENDISMEEEDSEFLFDRCIYASLDADKIESAEFDEKNTGRFVDDSDWTEVANLLVEAKETGKMLNIIIGDKYDISNLKQIAIIDAVEVVGQISNITFVFPDNLDRLETPIPVSVLHRCDGSSLSGGTIGNAYTICDSPWFLNVYLEDIFGGTSAEDFKNALLNANVTMKQREMLKHHYQAAKHAISMATMARLMGYKNFNAANLHYGKFAARIAEHLGFPIESDRDNISTLAFACEARDEIGHFQWEMHSELAQALEELGWVGETLAPVANYPSLSEPG